VTKQARLRTRLGERTKEGEAQVIPIEVDKLKPYKGYTFPDLSPGEREALKKSIEMEGIHDPLQIAHEDGDGTYTILTGKNRWEIAKDLKLPEVPCIKRSIPEDQRKAFLIYDNVIRRQLTGDARDQVIRDLRQEGKSFRAIADLLKVSHVTVKNVVDRSVVKNLTPGQDKLGSGSADEAPEKIIGRDGKTYPKRGNRRKQVRPSVKKQRLQRIDQEKYDAVWKLLEATVRAFPDKKYPRKLIVQVLRDLAAKYAG